MSTRSLALLCIAAFLAAGLMAAGASLMPGDAATSIERLRTWAERGPATAIAGSVLLMTLHSFTPAPAELIAIGNGVVFGPLLGFVVTWCGAMTGAAVAFAIARRVGRPALPYVLSDSLCVTIRGWQGRPGQLLLVRLVPLISFNLINYAAGLSGIGWWMFLWTTGIGIVPITLLSVMLGESLIEGAWAAALAIGGLLLLLTLVFPLVRRWRARSVS